MGVAVRRALTHLQLLGAGSLQQGALVTGVAMACGVGGSNATPRPPHGPHEGPPLALPSQDISPAVAATIAYEMPRVMARPHQYLIREGEVGDCMFFLARGMVEVVVRGPDRRNERILCTLKEVCAWALYGGWRLAGRPRRQRG